LVLATVAQEASVDSLPDRQSTQQAQAEGCLLLLELALPVVLSTSRAA
jgi:hypothetical protein